MLEIIKDYKEVSGYEIYGYCLMSNHIHLLIKEREEDLGIVFRRIGAKYVYWYNWKYKRRGHLFQDRYKSEVVEDDSYFLTVLRYIHQNPVKAGVEKDIKKYQWSSYKEYLGKKEICETKFGLNLFFRDKKRAISLFESFHMQENDDTCLDHEEGIRKNDIEAIEIIKQVACVRNLNEIKDFENEERDRVIKEFKNRGLSIRQIERLTGLSFGVIRRI